MIITIYTDGSCNYRDRTGGWGALIVISDTFDENMDDLAGVQIELSGYASNTTVNRMEVMAAINSLEAIAQPAYINVITDSMYLKHMGEKTITPSGVCGITPDTSNYKLLVRLHRQLAKHNVVFTHVRGHSGVPGNERADELAGNARKKLLKKLKVK